MTKDEFAAFVKEHKVSMYRLALSLLSNSHDAEDAVCSAVCRAYEGRNSLHKQEAFKSWILRITYNEAVNIMRRNKRLICVEDFHEDILPAEADRQENIWEYVMRLNDKHKEVVNLYYFEDMSVRQISEILDIGESTVKTRLSRARLRLRDMLIREGGYSNEQNI